MEGVAGMFLFGNKNLVALDIGSSSIKLAEIDFSARGPVLKKFTIQPLSPGIVSGGEIEAVDALSQSITATMQAAKSKRKYASTGMWGNSVIVKKIAMPKMDEKLVGEQIKWEAEQYIPFDINEVSLDYHVLSERSASSEQTEVLLVAAKQDFLFRIIESVEVSGLKCSVIDVAGFALANCFEANYGKVDGVVALLNIGASNANFAVVEQGEVIFCRDIPVGGINFSQEVSKSMGVSFAEAEALKVSASLGQEVPDEVNGILSSVNEQVAEEIRNSFDFFSATSGGSPINKMYVSGGCIFVPGMVDAVAAATGVAYEVMDPFRRLAYDPKLITPDYIEQIKTISPIALGLGLRKHSDR